MPFGKLLIKAKAKGARGTEQASEMLELMQENWEQIQEKFSGQTESEKDEMLEHFNNALDSLGDTLFGEDASPEEFKNFVNVLADEEGNIFLEAVKEALLIEAP